MAGDDSADRARVSVSHPPSRDRTLQVERTDAPRLRIGAVKHRRGTSLRQRWAIYPPPADSLRLAGRTEYPRGNCPPSRHVAGFRARRTRGAPRQNRPGAPRLAALTPAETWTCDAFSVSCRLLSLASQPCEPWLAPACLSLAPGRLPAVHGPQLCTGRD